MGMNTGGGGHRKAVSDINVTPLVDVMLVLLVVFMVTVPEMMKPPSQRKVEVDLPTTNAAPIQAKEVETIVILSLDLKVQLDLGQGPSELADCAGSKGKFDACLSGLEDKLKGNPKLQDAARVFLMADRGLPYGFVVDVMARMKNAGIGNLGMVTNPPGEAP